MIKVQLRDGRIKEFKDKTQAETYAQVSGGQIVTKVKKAPKRRTLKQFWERT